MSTAESCILILKKEKLERNNNIKIINVIQVSDILKIVNCWSFVNQDF